jgi:pyruvate/2-oxoglutarate dehydrogenase complex dihydrolipoamide acyltransferase (E2) component
MKFLEAKRKAGQQENKMQPGSRVDQREPHTSATSKIDLGPDKPKIRPEVAKLAEELDVDLNKVKGTGLNGIILVKDVRAFKAKELDDELLPESTELDPD